MNSYTCTMYFKNLVFGFLKIDTTDIPCPGCLPREVEEDIDVIDGGIDLEIIVTGSSSDGNANVEGWGSGECSLGDLRCWLSNSAAVVSRGVRGLTSRLGGSSLTELAFGILERSVNDKTSSLNKL